MKNFPVLYKQILSVGLVVLSMGWCLYESINALHESESAYDVAINHDMKEASYAKDIQVHMLECRRNEKDFFLRLDLKYQKKIHGNIAKVDKAAQAIIDLSEDHGAQTPEEIQIDKDAHTIIKLMDGYGVVFDAVVAAWLEHGLDHKTGLQGSFRSKVHDLMNAFVGLDNKDLYIEVLLLRRHEKDYLLRGTEKYSKKVIASLAKLKLGVTALGAEAIEDGDELGENDNDNEEKEEKVADVSKLQLLIESFRVDFLALVEIKKTIKIRIDEMRDLVHGIAPLATSLEKQSLAVVEKTVANASSEAERSLSRVKTISSIIGIIGFVFGIMIALGISRPLSQMVKVATLAADGDVSQRMHLERKDEIGQVSAAFDNMLEMLSTMIGEVQSCANNLLTSSAELGGVSEQLGGRSKELTEQAGTLAGSVDVSNKSMQQLNHETEDVSRATVTVAGAIEEMTITVKEISANAAKASTVTQAASQNSKGVIAAMDELGRTSTEISVVVDAINDIAAQTKLLALNATIEAARAGEAGKGFAVVANEVKQLSQETEKATEEITAKVVGIQKAAEDMSTKVKENAEEIGSVTDVSGMIASAVEEQAITINEISDNVTKVTEASQRMAGSVEGAAKVSADIATVGESLSASATGANSSASETQSCVEALTKMAEDLKESVSKFKV